MWRLKLQKKTKRGQDTSRFKHVVWDSRQWADQMMLCHKHDVNAALLLTLMSGQCSESWTSLETYTHLHTWSNWAEMSRAPACWEFWGNLRQEPTQTKRTCEALDRWWGWNVEPWSCEVEVPTVQVTASKRCGFTKTRSRGILGIVWKTFGKSTAFFLCACITAVQLWE